MGLFMKRNVWWFIKQFNGRRYEESLHTSIKRLAERKYFEDILPKILNGSYGLEPDTIPTIKEVIERYMREISPMQKSHRRNTEIVSHFYGFFGDALVCEAKLLIAAYKAKRLTGELIYGRGRGRRAGDSTLKKELGFLRQIFNKAIDEWDDDWNGYFRKNPDNPARRAIKGLKEVERVRYVLPEEAEKLRISLKQSKMALLPEIVIVACQTGLRASNLVNLTMSQCDFENSRIIIPAEKMKNGKPFSAKMTTMAKEVLLRVVKMRKFISPFVFTNDRGSPYTVNAVSMAFSRACKRAGISNLHYHDLRHDFASSLVNRGASLYKIQVNMAHSDMRMTQRYAHLLPENADIVDIIDNKGTAAILAGESEYSTTVLRPEVKNKGVTFP